jgi:dipeptidyl aminopeptidase/acylaminoacyl peptidase
MFITGWWLGQQPKITATVANRIPGGMTSPLISNNTPPPSPLPFLQYTIPSLRQQQYASSQITLTEELDRSEDWIAYRFQYQTTGKTMTGQLTVPSDYSPSNQTPVIIMLRGWAPSDDYYTGLGTKPAATYYSAQGLITLAPDFLGYGHSDPAPEDSWEGRFIKPLQVAELITSVEKNGIPLSLETSQSLAPNQIALGIWGHSNGGQIALTTLEILKRPIPTTLWAPVTVPVPYSVLYFGDELEDEGQAQRAWLASLEKNYNLLEFSHTQYLHLLADGLPLQIHHGTNDDAALHWWSDEFVDKLESETDRRRQGGTNRRQQVATSSGRTAEQTTLPAGIDVEYYRYPGSDHNLRPAWQTEVERDVAFFRQHLLNE